MPGATCNSSSTASVDNHFTRCQRLSNGAHDSVERHGRESNTVYPLQAADGNEPNVPKNWHPTASLGTHEGTRPAPGGIFRSL